MNKCQVEEVYDKQGGECENCFCCAIFLTALQQLSGVAFPSCRLGLSYDLEDVGIFLARPWIGAICSPVFAGFVQATPPTLLSVCYNDLVLTMSKSTTSPACISLALWPSTQQHGIGTVNMSARGNAQLWIPSGEFDTFCDVH